MPREIDQSIALAALQGLRTRQDVAAFFGVSLSRFDYHLYVRRQPSRTIEFPKKTGGIRTIHSPPEPISIFQKKLAKYLRDSYSRKDNVYGFCLEGGVAKGARRHVRAKQLLNLDLEDFFGSITFARVYGMLKSPPLSLSHASASMLANLCCWHEKLPQGAPTSPIVSNWICRKMDNALRRLASKSRCSYSRYADDITFSTRRLSLPVQVLEYRVGDDVGLGKELLSLIEGNGFRVNGRKVWVRSPHERQTVTGVVVNAKPNVPREYRRQIRAALHGWERKGLASAQSKLASLYPKARAKPGAPELPSYLAGKIEFLKQVRGEDDPLYARQALQLERLRRRDGVGKPGSVRLVGEPSLVPSHLRESLWIIVAFAVRGTDEYELGNGTGFSLHGVGLVTNAHVIDAKSYSEELDAVQELEGDGFEVKIRARPASQAQWQAAEIFRTSLHHDLAIIDVADPSLACLSAASEKPIQGDPITLAGFPNWSEGDEARIEHGSVTKTKHKSLVHWIQLNATVLPGNSGGPVLDEEGRVVGVATVGEDGLPLPHAAVWIGHLRDCTRRQDHAEQLGATHQ